MLYVEGVAITAAPLFLQGSREPDCAVMSV